MSRIACHVPVTQTDHRPHVVRILTLGFAFKRIQTGAQRCIFFPRFLRHGTHGIKLFARDEVAVSQPAIDHAFHSILGLFARTLGDAHSVGHQLGHIVKNLVTGLHHSLRSLFGDYMGVDPTRGKVDFLCYPGSISAMKAMLPFPDISPEIFSVTLFGMELALRWYALAYIVGILLGWRLAVAAVRTPRLWRDNRPVMTPAQVEDLLFWVILGVILGGRLGYVLFYQAGFYLANPLRILQLWEGGMSFHGGAIGVIVAAFFFTKRHGIATLSAGDMVTLGLAPGLFLGRMANFINAELWGRPTDVPWGVAFPTQAAQYCPDVAGICARHPSQLYEALLEGLVLGALLIWLAWRRGGLKREGLLIGVFLAGYGAARFAVEFVRQPDAQFITLGNPLGLALHIDGVGLTMGQLLCIPMILIGVFFILRARREA